MMIVIPYQEKSRKKIFSLFTSNNYIVISKVNLIHFPNNVGTAIYTLKCLDGMKILQRKESRQMVHLMIK